MVYAVSGQSETLKLATGQHTSRNAVHFVLDEEVDEWHKCCEEGAGEKLPVLNGSGVAWAQSKAAEGPWQSSHQV